MGLTYCKVDQSGSIVVKLKLDMPCLLLNAYTKFQIDITSHFEKRQENSDERTLPRHITTVFQTGI